MSSVAFAAVARDPDGDLASAIGEGRLEALALAYRRYGTLAYTIATRIAPDGPAAEAAVEAAFLELWRSPLGDGRAARLRDRLLLLVAREALARAGTATAVIEAQRSVPAVAAAAAAAR